MIRVFITFLETAFIHSFEGDEGEQMNEEIN